MHRLILGLEPFDPLEGDHINGNTLDNRDSNLRIATSQQNARNRRVHSNNLTGMKGITYDPRSNRWMARIMVDGKSVWLGYHATKEEAYAVYKAAELLYFGEFTRLV